MDSPPPTGPNLPAPRRTSAEVLKERLADSRIAAGEGTPRRRKSPVSDVDETVGLALKVGGLEVTVAGHSSQIAALLAAGSRAETLLTSMAQRMTDIANKMTLDKALHESTQQLLLQNEASQTAQEATLRELVGDKAIRLQHDAAVKAALEQSNAAARADREEQARRIVTYLKRGLAGVGTLILVMLPSAISTAPPDLHQYLYPALLVLGFIFVFGGIPALLWGGRQKK